VALAVEPEDGAPVVAVGGVDLAQRGGDAFDVGELLGDRVDHAEERFGVELGLGLVRDLGAFDAEALLQVFLVANQDVALLGDLAELFDGAGRPAGGGPQLGAVVQIEAGDRAGGLGGLHAFEDQLRGRVRQGGEDAAGVEPADALSEYFLPVEIARLEHSAGLVGPVVENHRRANAGAAVGTNGGDVRAAAAV